MPCFPLGDGCCDSLAPSETGQEIEAKSDTGRSLSPRAAGGAAEAANASRRWRDSLGSAPLRGPAPGRIAGSRASAMSPDDLQEHARVPDGVFPRRRRRRGVRVRQNRRPLSFPVRGGAHSCGAPQRASHPATRPFCKASSCFHANAFVWAPGGEDRTSADAG